MSFPSRSQAATPGPAFRRLSAPAQHFLRGCFARSTPQFRALGIRLQAIEDRGVTAELPYRVTLSEPREAQRIGRAYVTALIEASCNMAARLYLMAPVTLVNLRLRADHLEQPPVETAVTCTARCVHKDGTRLHLEAHCHAGESGTPITIASSVLSVISPTQAPR